MSAELISQIVSASLALITLLTGALVAAVPWLTRRREAFAVTVPESAQADPRIGRMRKAYLAAVLAVTVASAAGTYLLGTARPIAASVVVCLPPAAGFLLMLHFRSRVRALKREQGWTARGAQASSVAGAADRNAPKPLPLSVNLLYLPVILITCAIALALYPAMPDPVPVHFNAAGVADDCMEKGWQVLAMPAAIQLFLAVCFTATHWMIRRSKRPTSPENPAASALAYGMFARAQSAALLVTGLVVTASIVIMPLAFAGVVTSEQSVVALIIICVAAIVPGIAVSVVYGQSGSRLLRRMGASGGLAFDDDEHWKAGVFYVNREDPSVVLPKRFGIGWAMNWGNPRSWLLTVALIALVVGFVVGMGLLL